MDYLTFGRENAKLALSGRTVATLTLPAGHAVCIGALHCLASANRRTGRITDGPEQTFRCFEASSEARSPNLRKMVWRNLRMLERAHTVTGMRDLILRSLAQYAWLVDCYMRVHVGGDYYRREYLDAWCNVAIERPDVVFYSYTKSISLFLGRKLPDNLRITASRGGRQDFLIEASGLRTSTVVYSESEAIALGLEIDHDDTHAQGTGGSFALLIHGTQRKGSAAAAALRALR